MIMRVCFKKKKNICANMPYLTMIYVVSALVMQNQQLIGNDSGPLLHADRHQTSLYRTAITVSIFWPIRRTLFISLISDESCSCPIVTNKWGRCPQKYELRTMCSSVIGTLKNKAHQRLTMPALHAAWWVSTCGSKVSVSVCVCMPIWARFTAFDPGP